MNASKENARVALQKLTELSDGMSPGHRTGLSHLIIALQEFIESAEKRLPSEAAIARDKARKRTKKA